MSHCGSGGVPGAGVGAERAKHNGLDGLWDFGVDLPRLRKPPAEDVSDSFLAIVRIDEPAIGERFVHDGAQAVDVRTAIDTGLAELLRCNVRELSLDLLSGRLSGSKRALGDSEVGDLHLSLPRDQNVTRRHVAVYDAERPIVAIDAAVGVVETLQSFDGDVDQMPVRNRLLKTPLARLEQIAEMHACDVFHGEKKLIIDAAGVERLDDVRVRKPHREPRLVDEEGSKLVVLRQIPANDFQGNHLLGAA